MLLHQSWVQERAALEGNAWMRLGLDVLVLIQLCRLSTISRTLAPTHVPRIVAHAPISMSLIRVLLPKYSPFPPHYGIVSRS